MNDAQIATSNQPLIIAYPELSCSSCTTDIQRCMLCFMIYKFCYLLKQTGVQKKKLFHKDKRKDSGFSESFEDRTPEEEEPKTAGTFCLMSEPLTEEEPSSPPPIPPPRLPRQQSERAVSPSIRPPPPPREVATEHRGFRQPPPREPSMKHNSFRPPLSSEPSTEHHGFRLMPVSPPPKPPPRPLYTLNIACMVNHWSQSLTETGENQMEKHQKKQKGETKLLLGWYNLISYMS